MKKSIIARGIRVNNLKNIDIEIPHKKLVVITGVSGSGKSSLAFDTLFAEGQRRYVESFSAYARQFLERMDKPDIDHIEGIPPAIAIQQKNPVKNRRSTVGTATEINDYLRLLFARVGKTYCANCKRHVQIDTVSQIVETVLSLPEGTKFLVTFPIAVSQKVSGQSQINLLKERGLVRILADNAIVDITTEIKDWDIRTAKSVYGIIDRLVVKDVIKERLVDALETSYRLGAGHLSIIYNILNTPAYPDIHLQGHPLIIQESPWVELRYSKQFFCSYCAIEYPEPVPVLFSFNNPIGACPKCQGFGYTIEIDMDSVMPDKEKTLNEGAIAPWNTPTYSTMFDSLKKSSSNYGIPLDVPFRKLTKEQARLIWEGTEDFCGIRDFFAWLEQRKYKMHVRVFLSKYRGYTLCPACNGRRLKSQALNVLINHKNIADVCIMTIDDAYQFFEEIQLTEYEKNIAHLLLQEIKKRLDYMIKVGLGYLTLDRMTRTLSGGEAQRVNLTTSLGSSLVNTLYILDEPSIGLHPRDTERLIQILERLRDIGNTVVVVEHDEEVIKAADEIVDLGPGAGENGGMLVYQGPFQDLPARNGSLTGQYLKGDKAIKIPPERRKPSTRAIVLKGASQNNLKGIDVVFPLHMLVCVTGVSGSGKSTLVQDTLYGAIKKKREGYAGFVGKYESIQGVQFINDVILVDQSPIGRTPRSNPITYIKVFDEIRRLFSSTRDAKIRNLSVGSFSFNVVGGRCEQCEGAGSIRVDMQFLADIYVTCDKCNGKRFNKKVLDVQYKSMSIHEVLEMTVDGAIAFFSDSPRITRGLKFLQDTGLGYLRLGQPATTLSGGEAQRLKIATYMAQENPDAMLFIFDEPTIGLHMDDVQKLLTCFQQLIQAGHSLIVVEHNLDVIKSADYIIDLGPEGGGEGGYIVGCGTPEQIAQRETSYTGRYLKPCFS
ncbi:MAG: excinuclease ABC subunit UvrA [Candidatus Brocadia sinica]|nr:excinuclease ABC subunit UvrA [Candidatus Brocadia sinica]NUO06167.1 excinuclease ABC subunit UvrA [Candidatus Brocadia sinica]